MKSKIFILLFVLLSVKIFSQTELDKSYYLKRAVVVCPIDITKLYTKDGLIVPDNSTIEIKETKDSLTVSKDSNKKEVVKFIRKDTVYKYPIIIESGYAFNIIQQIGSFSIIKFWPIDKNRSGGLLKTIINNIQPKSVKEEESKDHNTDNNSTQKNSNTKQNTDKKEELNNLYESNNIVGLRMSINDNNQLDLSKFYYIIKTEDIRLKSVEFENKTGLWNIGLLVMPIKIRPLATESGQFDFSEGVSVGYRNK